MPIREPTTMQELMELLEGQALYVLKDDALYSLSDDEELLCTIASLHKIDTRLPTLLKVLCRESDKYYKNPVDVVNGNMLFNTLDFWAARKTVINASGQLVPYTELHLIEVDSRGEGEHVYVLGLFSEAVAFEIEPGKREYYITSTNALEEYELDIAWLNQMYPGWRNRYDAGLTCGLERDELLGFTLGEALANKQNLNVDDITFE